jgi:HSP20 family protein
MVWDIFDEMRRMQEEMDRVFSSFFAHPPYRQIGPGRHDVEPVKKMPALRRAFVDVQETDSDIIVTAELPGMDKDDIELNVMPDRLEIKAQKKEERTEEKEGYKAYGSRYAGFFRSVPLSTPVKADDTRATYKHGVLEITLPKREVTTSRTITID